MLLKLLGLGAFICICLILMCLTATMEPVQTLNTNLLINSIIYDACLTVPDMTKFTLRKTPNNPWKEC